MELPLPTRAKKQIEKVAKKLIVREEKSLNSRIQAGMRKLVKLSTYKPEQKAWLDTGYPDLNAALGSRVRGIRYGCITELRGVEHGGKTLISLLLAGLAQRDGAMVGLLDVEQSRDRDWSEKFGVNYDDLVKIWPKLIERKDKHPRLESAEELFQEAEAAMALMAQYGAKKQFWIVDSVAMLRTKMAIVGSKKQEAAGAAPDRNMRVNGDRAAFLSEKLPDWVGLAAGYNAHIILVNQMRTTPGVVYGDPRYSPGGRAMVHACAVRANVGRIGHGKVVNGGKVVGLLTKIENFKNKAGGKSVQGDTCVVKIRWDKHPARIKVYSETEGKKEL